LAFLFCSFDEILADFGCKALDIPPDSIMGPELLPRIYSELKSGKINPYSFLL